MHHKKLFVYILICACFFTLCAHTDAPLRTSPISKNIEYKTADYKAAEVWADSVMSTLTFNEKVAQLFVPRIDAFNNAEGREMLKRAINQGVGGFLLGKGTVEGYAALINYAQEQAKVPLLVTLDGEWGLNMRVSNAPQFPYNMTLGAITNPDLLYEYGREVGRECRAVGINVDFAPVLDVNSNPQNPVIGNRSFGEDPERVAQLGIAYSLGLESEGILSVAKHFPGHGDTDSDSHKTLPKVGHSLSILENVDLLPFQKYIDARLNGIMVGHLNVPALDASGTPSSLSKRITTNLLKEKMKFKGLIFTDALAMKGAVSGSKNNCVAALEAGADVILQPANTKTDMAAVISAVNTGTIDKKNIEQRCRKLLIYKYLLGLANFKPANLAEIKNNVSSPEAEAVINKLSDGAITALKNENNLLPLRDLEKRNIVVAIAGDASNCPFATYCNKYAQCKTIKLDGAPTSEQSQLLNQADIVILAVMNDKAASQQAANRIAKLNNSVAVFFLNPYKMTPFSSSLSLFSTAICAYQPLPSLQRAAAEALFGGIDVTGRFPVNVKGIASMGAGLSLPKVRLGYSSPAAEGMNRNLGAVIDSIVNNAIKAGAMTGCQVAVAKNGQMVLERAYGRIDNNPNSATVTTETLFDLASVTKATATLAGLMKAYDEGLLELDAPISDYIENLDSTEIASVTTRQLLFHESGIPATLNVFRFALDPETYSGTGAPGANSMLRSDIFANTESTEFPYRVAKGIFISDDGVDELAEKVHNVSLHSKKYEYSDLNFMLLKEIQENVTGVALDQWVETEILSPLGAWHTLYNPLDRFNQSQIAATENDQNFRRQKIHGTVHDELAACMGGVSGNAGLFSTAGDVAKICQMWLSNGAYGGEHIIKPATVNKFTSEKSKSGSRGLGFDLLSRNRSMDSPRASKDTYGHTGFTGTCFWVDPQNNLIIVFLSNRVNPSRDNAAWNRLSPRTAVIKAVYSALP